MKGSIMNTVKNESAYEIQYNHKKARITCSNSDGSRTVVSFREGKYRGDESYSSQDINVKIYTFQPTKKINTTNKKLAALLSKIYTKRKVEYSAAWSGCDDFHTVKGCLDYIQKNASSSLTQYPNVDRVLIKASSMLLNKMNQDAEITRKQREEMAQKVCQNVHI